MKLKDKQHIASMSHEELLVQLGEVNKLITELNLGKHTKPVKNTRVIRTLREKCAVIQTKINETKEETTKEK